jgi:lysophospholipase L1-like esterase
MKTIQSNYSDIIDLIRKKCPDAQLYVQSNLPCDQSVSAELTNDVLVNHVRELNGFLQTQCAEKGATFINLYPLFEIEGKRLDPKLTYDGLHLNHEGYIVWTNAIQNVMAN